MANNTVTWQDNTIIFTNPENFGLSKVQLLNPDQSECSAPPWTMNHVRGVCTGTLIWKGDKTYNVPFTTGGTAPEKALYFGTSSFPSGALAP